MKTFRASPCPAFAVFFVAAAFAATGALAEGARRNEGSPPSTVRCPPIIADGATGALHPVGPRSKRFQCFDSSREAVAAGYLSARTQKRLDLSAWWRLAVTLASDTCGGAAADAEKKVTIFLQLREKGAAVFGEICPSPYRYVGRRTEDGVLLSASQVIEDDPNCPGRRSEVTFLVDLGKVTRTGAGSARYKRIRRCLSDPPVEPCATEWTGVAFKETSHVFPPVPGNVNAFSVGCAMTQTTCTDCHQ